MSLHLHWTGFTHSGSKKPRNDDALLAFASGPAGAVALETSGSQPLATNDLVFAISDGVGGANAGYLASSLILKRMSEIVPETFKLAASGFFPDRLAYLEEAIQSIHLDVNRAGNSSQENHGMSATLAMAWFTPENIYIANVGDSRIYLSRGGNLKQLSRDHTSAWAQWKRGEIGEVQYRTHPRRAALYEVIGGGHEHIAPHMAAVPYETNDRILICSDGLIDGVWERHITNALADASSAEDAANMLLKRSLANSGVDDTTLYVIDVC